MIRLGDSTKSTIEEHTDMFNLFFYILCFENFQPRFKLFFQVVRNLLAKIVHLGMQMRVRARAQTQPHSHALDLQPLVACGP